MSDELIQMIVHNPWPFGNNERKKVGEFEGIEIFSDTDLPDDELRIVQNGSVVQRFKLSH